jgi:hypothetical protein
LKKGTGKPVDETETRVPPIIDRSLEIVLDLERQFIKAGINMPVGGSLLMIARKR